MRMMSRAFSVDSLPRLVYHSGVIEPEVLSHVDFLS